MSAMGQASGVVPPLRILHVFSTFAVGGPQMRFAAIANAFGGRYDHTVIALDGRTEAASLVRPEVGLRLVAAPSAAGALLPARVARYRAALRRLRPDLLVTYNWGAIEWGLADFIPICRHVHIEDGFGPEEADRQLPRRVWARRLALMPHATVVLPSRTLYALARERWRLPKSRLVYLPNGIDVDRFARGGDRELLARRHVPQDLPLIGTVTVLRREKNLKRMIAAFAVARRTTPARLLIVGDGPEKSDLEAFGAQRGLGDVVIFLGQIDDAARILRAINIFALSSDTEQMPMSVLEAMAAERVIAGVDVGDVKEMVSESNRPFIVERDEVALAKVLSHLLPRPDLCDRIGRKNQEKTRSEFSQQRMLSAYRIIFDGPETSGDDRAGAEGKKSRLVNSA